MKNQIRTFCLMVAGLLLAMPSLHAQSYSMDWHYVGGGGGTSTGGVYSVSGTIGQPDAGGAMSGANFSLTGGFWSLYSAQTAGVPLLAITYANNQVVVSWSPSSTGWTLQTNAGLATDSWGDYTALVVNNSTTNSPLTGNVFFRLKQ